MLYINEGNNFLFSNNITNESGNSMIVYIDDETLIFPIQVSGITERFSTYIIDFGEDIKEKGMYNYKIINNVSNVIEIGILSYKLDIIVDDYI